MKRQTQLPYAQSRVLSIRDSNQTLLLSPAQHLHPRSHTHAARMNDIDQSIEEAGKPPAGIVLPPRDIRAIVEKTAGYVARNGQVFERKFPRAPLPSIPSLISQSAFAKRKSTTPSSLSSTAPIRTLASTSGASRRSGPAAAPHSPPGARLVRRSPPPRPRPRSLRGPRSRRSSASRHACPTSRPRTSTSCA